MTHTPRPWTVRQGDIVYAENGRFIADCERTPYEKRPAPPDPCDKANANLIVRAVNSHAVMLEALKKALDHVQSHIESDVLYGRIANFEDHELADTHRMLWLTLDTMGETK